MMALATLARLIPGWLYVALVLAGAVTACGYHAGKASVQTDWDADKDARSIAENKAAIQRDAENAALAKQQVATAAAIQGKHDDEIASVRVALNAAGRMRLPAFCRPAAATADPSSAQGSNAADTGAGVVPGRVAADIRAMILTAEESAAAGRAAQAFIRANGMSP